MSHTKHDTDGPCRDCIREIKARRGISQSKIAGEASISTGGLSEYLSKTLPHKGIHDRLYNWIEANKQHTAKPKASEPITIKKSPSFDITEKIRRALSDDSESIGEYSSSEDEKGKLEQPEPDGNFIALPNYVLWYNKYKERLDKIKLPPNYKLIAEYGFVYILTDQTTRVKIGISRDVPGRKNNLFTGNPDLRCAGFHASWFYMHAEETIHEILKDCVYKKKWEKHQPNKKADGLSNATEFFVVDPDEARFLVEMVTTVLERLYHNQIKLTRPMNC